jgi:LPXTG-motif cell wall-anchored protein
MKKVIIMRKRTNKFLAAALSCSIASAMLGGTAAYAADTQTGAPETVAEQQLPSDTDMSKYFGDWELYQIDSAPVTSEDQVIKLAVKDDHSFKIDDKDYKWTVYEDGERMQVLTMEGEGFGIVTMEDDTLVHYLAGSKWYFKRTDADIPATTENVTDPELTTENATDSELTTENATDSELTTENVTESETETTEIAADPEITTEIVTETTAEGTTLPQTGMSGSHKVFAGLSALMGIAGIGLVKKSRKEE